MTHEEEPTPAPRRVERIVSTALDATIVRCRRPAVGSVAETFLLELNGTPSRAVCKIDGASVWTGDVIEPFVVRLVDGTTDLRVPDVLATGSIRDEPSGRTSRWALYEFRDGSNPDPWYRTADPGVRRRIVSDAAGALGRLHAAHRTDRIGGLERVGDAVGACRSDGFHGSLHRGTLESSVIPPPSADRRPVLTHGDFHPGNLLVTESGALTAILDWGNAHVTHAGYALARAEARFVDRFRFPRAERETLRSLLRERYSDHAPIEPGFSGRAATYKGLWLAQSAANVVHVARSNRGRTQLRRQLRAYWNRRR